MARLIANGIAAQKQQVDSSNLIFKTAPHPLVPLDCSKPDCEWIYENEVDALLKYLEHIGVKTPIPKHLQKDVKRGFGDVSEEKMSW